MIMRRFVVLAVSTAAIGAACGASDDARVAPDDSPGVSPPPEVTAATTSDPWRVLAAGEVDESEPRQLVVDDAGRLDDEWRDLGLPGATPDVDFDESIVIIRSEGYGSGCEPIFRRISIREDRRTVEPQFVGFEPGHECGADERWYALAVEVRREALEPGGYTLIGRSEQVPIP